MHQTFPWSKLSSKAPTYWLVKILVGSSRDGAQRSIRNHRPVILESLSRCVLCFLRAPSISSSLVDWHTGFKVGSFIHSFYYRFLKTHGRVAPCVVTRKVRGVAVHSGEPGNRARPESGWTELQSPSTSDLLSLFFFSFFVLFETGFLRIAFAVLELYLWTRLALNS